MEFKQQEGESGADYLKRLFAEGDRCVSDIKKTKEDMKRDGVIGFCKECGCHIYENKEHKCS